MTGPAYKKFLLKGKKKSSAAPAIDFSTDAEIAKKRKLDVLGGGNSSAEVTPPPTIVILPPVSPPPPLPPPPQTPTGYVVSLEPGELWRNGVSDRLRVVLRPPPQLMGGSVLTSDIRAMLSRMEAESLKTISLIQSFQDFHQRLDLSETSCRSLALKVDELSRILGDLTKQKEDLGKEKDDLTQQKSELEAEIQTLRSDLAKAKEDLEVEVREREASSKLLADKVAQMAKLQAKFEEARALIENAVVQSFENAIAQAQVLNPGLITDGMDVSYEVKDGTIVPGTSDSGVPDEEEVTEVDDAAAGDHVD